MNTKRSVANSIWLAATVLVLVVVVVVTAAHKWPKGRSAQVTRQQQEDRVKDVLPPVISSLKGIEVVSAFIDDRGRANIIVVNNTDRGIKALAISSGNFMSSVDNGPREWNLPPLIPPHSTYTFQELVSNLRASSPLRISAIVYDDETEDGDADVRKTIRGTRDREKQRRLQESNKKAGN